MGDIPASLRFLLDTNIVSDLVRRPQGPVAARIAEEGAESVCIDVIVAAELRFGVQKRSSPKLAARIEAILSEIEILPLESPVEAAYAEIRHALETRGTPIGPNDLLIAAHARSLGLTLVTANLDEFRRVPGLGVENWLE
jgi:tRNA(fMet)-specific endonuclease VapC